MMCLFGEEMFLSQSMSPQSLWPQSFFAKANCLSFLAVSWVFFVVPRGFVVLDSILLHTSKRTQKSMERGPKEWMPELSYPVRQHCSLSEGASCLENGYNKFLVQEIEAVLWAVRIHNPFGKFHVGPIPTNSFLIHCSVLFCYCLLPSLNTTDCSLIWLFKSKSMAVTLSWQRNRKHIKKQFVLSLAGAIHNPTKGFQTTDAPGLDSLHVLVHHFDKYVC